MTTGILGPVTFSINWLAPPTKTGLLSQAVSEFTEGAFSLSTTQYYQNWVEKANQDPELSTFLQHEDDDFLDELAELEKGSPEKARRKAPSRPRSSSPPAAPKKSGTWKEKPRDPLQNRPNPSPKGNQNQSSELSNEEPNLNPGTKPFAHHGRASGLHPVNRTFQRWLEEERHSALNQTFAQWLENPRNSEQTQNTRANPSGNSSENPNLNQNPHPTPETSPPEQRNMSGERGNGNPNGGGFTPEQMRQLQALITLMSSNTPGPPGERGIPGAEGPPGRDSSSSSNGF